MADPRCYACGAPLVLRHTRTGQEPFWGCKDYPDCEVTFNGGEAGPVRTRAWDGPPVAGKVLRAKQDLILDGSAAGLDQEGQWYRFFGMVLDAEDLLELGELRHQLQRAGRGQGSG